MNHLWITNKIFLTGSHAHRSFTHTDHCSLTHTYHSVSELNRDQINAVTAQGAFCMIWGYMLKIAEAVFLCRFNGTGRKKANFSITLAVISQRTDPIEPTPIDWCLSVLEWGMHLHLFNIRLEFRSWESVLNALWLHMKWLKGFMTTQLKFNIFKGINW